MNLLGGGSSAKRAAEESRRAQTIANDRQMAALNEQDQRNASTRRNPRGRRLFVGDAAQKGNLS